MNLPFQAGFSFRTMQAFSWKKYYHTLGRLVVAKQPEVAHQLLSEYCLKVVPSETDYSRMPLLWDRFCFAQGIKSGDYVGTQRSSSKVDIRRLFIAAMLHLYQPHAYHHPKDSILLKKGFQRRLAETLNLDEGWVNRLIRQVIARERVYEEFSMNVQLTVKMISNAQN